MGSNQWGLPDWRDEAAYVAPASAHIFYWKWQFTRRREDYRAAWAEAWERKHAALKERSPDTAAHPDSNNKFGMFHLVNPALVQYTKGSFQPLPGTAEIYTEEFEDFRKRRDGGLVSLEFDLTKPLKEQLERAGEVLARDAKDYGVRERRQHVVKWPTYLRVLDAREDKQTWETIAKQVLGFTRRDEPQAARQVWDAARQLMFNFPA